MRKGERRKEEETSGRSEERERKQGQKGREDKGTVRGKIGDLREEKTTDEKSRG